MAIVPVPSCLRDLTREKHPILVAGRTLEDVASDLRTQVPEFWEIYFREEGALKPGFEVRVNLKAVEDLSFPIQDTDQISFGLKGRRFRFFGLKLTVVAFFILLTTLILGAIFSESGPSWSLTTAILFFVGWGLVTTGVFGLCRVNWFSTAMICLVLGVLGTLRVHPWPLEIPPMKAAVCDSMDDQVEVRRERYQVYPGEWLVELQVFCVSPNGEELRVGPLVISFVVTGVYWVLGLVLAGVGRKLRWRLLDKIGRGYEPALVLI